MNQTFKSFQKYQISNLNIIKGGTQSTKTNTGQNAREQMSDKGSDVVTEEITFVVEDLQIA